MEKIKVKSKVEFQLDGVDLTSTDANEPEVQAAVANSIAEGAGVDPSKVTITKIEVVSVPGLRNLMSWSGLERFLQSSTRLIVEFEIEATNTSQATQLESTLKQVSAAAESG